MTNIDKLQHFYNKMISMADFCYNQSQSPEYIGIQEALTGKAEAYEATAEYFASTFPALVKTVRSLRQQEIERIYEEENKEDDLSTAEWIIGLKSLNKSYEDVTD